MTTTSPGPGSMPVAFEPAVTRDWDFPRQAAGTALLVQVGVEAGVPGDRLLLGSGLTVKDLADHQREVTADQELRVVRNLIAGVPRMTGIRVGARYHASTFGPLGFALMSSPTLADAANLTLRFLDLSFSFTTPSAVLDGERVRIAVDDRGVPADVRRFLVERDLAAIWTVFREIAGGEPRAERVVLPFDPAPDVGEHRAAFGVTPTWEPGGARAWIGLDAAWFARPLPQANAHAFAFAEQMCRELVSPRRSRHGITEHARILIAQRLEDGAPMDQVASALGLSERSLRRRLTEAGTTYRALLDDVRRAAAEELLADRRLHLDEVAHRLGYAEASSFLVAYRRWTGRTPRAARRA
ncbi:AraC family transcriptional regulator [Nocardioides sp. zg-ZUI104]|uniref:AraC family transcriptional regulator n=1 Tax=Nocardioides faecalis TaxID=2803858 RepID=UPI001BD043B6|nr:AraC family transcriptional regulator [Nocardioides faecalis]MBS4753873.1 AraC family transcriptional regulator [Nocardioides faecalis]